ncbi:MAG: hypothetical protein M0Q88_02720 [Bacilli bacterium]|nr:hypothetical protein [Bacilli bacterium]
MSKNRKILMLLLVLILVIGLSSFALAGGDDLKTDDIVDAIKGKGGGLMGPGLENTSKKLMNDIFNIVRLFVIGGLVIRGFFYIGGIQEAAEQPQQKSILKKRLLYTVIGIVIALNFWRIYNWIAGINITFS